MAAITSSSTMPKAASNSAGADLQSRGIEICLVKVAGEANERGVAFCSDRLDDRRGLLHKAREIGL